MLRQNITQTCIPAVRIHKRKEMIFKKETTINSALLGPFERNDCNEILHRLDNRDTFITIVKKVHLSVSFLV